MNIKKIETNFKYNILLKETDITSKMKEFGELETELITIYPSIQFQTFLGFGGAFTESAAYSLSNTNSDIYEKIIKEYFSDNGLGYTLCRTHINSCDFSLENYSYSNTESLNDFSIERDNKYLIPMIKTALKINSNIKLIASPWSPPAFMKDNNNMNNGRKIIREI